MFISSREAAEYFVRRVVIWYRNGKSLPDEDLQLGAYALLLVAGSKDVGLIQIIPVPPRSPFSYVGCDYKKTDEGRILQSVPREQNEVSPYVALMKMSGNTAATTIHTTSTKWLDKCFVAILQQEKLKGLPLDEVRIERLAEIIVEVVEVGIPFLNHTD